MERIQEILTWLMLAMFGCWFAANKIMPVGDQSGTEVAPAAGPAIPATTTPTITLTEKPYDDKFHASSVSAAGLSEMLNRRKIRRNMLRRKEDQRVL